MWSANSSLLRSPESVKAELRKAMNARRSFKDFTVLTQSATTSTKATESLGSGQAVRPKRRLDRSASSSLSATRSTKGKASKNIDIVITPTTPSSWCDLGGASGSSPSLPDPPVKSKVPEELKNAPSSDGDTDETPKAKPHRSRALWRRGHASQGTRSGTFAFVFAACSHHLFRQSEGDPGHK